MRTQKRFTNLGCAEQLHGWRGRRCRRPSARFRPILFFARKVCLILRVQIYVLLKYRISRSVAIAFPVLALPVPGSLGAQSPMRPPHHLPLSGTLRTVLHCSVLPRLPYPPTPQKHLFSCPAIPLGIKSCIDRVASSNRPKPLFVPTIRRFADVCRLYIHYHVGRKGIRPLLQMRR
jgi:hypothetical protein